MVCLFVFHHVPAAANFTLAVASQGVLQQVMNHKDAGIFQAYINQRVQCDVQAAFLGRPSADALLKTVSHMSRLADPRAPTKRSVSTSEIKTHPDIVKYRQLQDSLSQEARHAFGSIKNAKAQGSKIYQLYKEAGDALQCSKVKLRKTAVKESRNQFFDTIDTHEINKQLDLSLLDLNVTEWTPPKVEHCLTERKRVAGLLCQEPTHKASLGDRIETITALVALCRVQEAPREQNCTHDRTWGIKKNTTPEPDPVSLTCPSRQCLFCYKQLSRPRKACEHMERHLIFYQLDDPIPCPHPVCQKDGVILGGHMHFKYHAATSHNLSLSRKCG